MIVNLIVFSVLEAITLLIAVIYTAKYNGLSTYALMMVMVILLHFMQIALTILLVYFTYRASIEADKEVLAFHDFLIQYRQTPRSKILRRHLPSLDAVVEEASAFEQS